MFSDQEVHRTLVLAKALIEERGHAKGSFVGPDGRLCMRGALVLAITGEVDSCGWWFDDRVHQRIVACELAMEFESSLFGLVPSPITIFNNSPNTSLTKVLARFDLGIEATCDFDAEILPLLNLTHH